MKYLTIAVPCYNSESYMNRCIDSLLVGGEDIEIIIVNDGSTDRTGEIAEEYASLYPEIVRVVQKENGGHGSGVNAGLALAGGMYYKVVDSDDWLEEQAFRELLAKIRRHVKRGKVSPDLLICNYTYNHLDKGTARTIDFRNVFPEGKVCTWNDIGHFGPSQYLVMHALIYRTAVLRKSGIRLPEHMFYVDNIFASQPLPFVESICYLDLDLYQYYLGREDQSVNEKVLMARIDQQIKVTRIVAEGTDLDKVREKYPKLANYLCRNISVMMAISSIHLLLFQEKSAEEKRRRLWADVKRKNPRLYFRLKYMSLSGFTDLPGRLGRALTLGGYRLAKRVYQFQ